MSRRVRKEVSLRHRENKGKLFVLHEQNRGLSQSGYIQNITDLFHKCHPNCPVKFLMTSFLKVKKKRRRPEEMEEVEALESALICDVIKISLRKEIC